MVVDTSALVAILLLEAEAEVFARAIRDSDERLMSVASFLETAIIIDARRGPQSGRDLDDLVSGFGFEIEPVTLGQARIARQAYQDFGKGNHPAALNFGDCFAYALAKATGSPLLYKGNDFSKTDIARAL